MRSVVRPNGAVGSWSAVLDVRLLRPLNGKPRCEYIGSWWTRRERGIREVARHTAAFHAETDVAVHWQATWTRRTTRRCKCNGCRFSRFLRQESRWYQGIHWGVYVTSSIAVALDHATVNNSGQKYGDALIGRSHEGKPCDREPPIRQESSLLQAVEL